MRKDRSRAPSVVLGLGLALLAAGCATPIEIPGTPDPMGRHDSGYAEWGDAAVRGDLETGAFADAGVYADAAPAVVGDGALADAVPGGDARLGDASTDDASADDASADDASAGDATPLPDALGDAAIDDAMITGGDAGAGGDDA